MSNLLRWLWKRGRDEHGLGSEYFLRRNRNFGPAYRGRLRRRGAVRQGGGRCAAEPTDCCISRKVAPGTSCSACHDGCHSAGESTGPSNSCTEPSGANEASARSCAHSRKGCSETG